PSSLPASRRFGLGRIGARARHSAREPDGPGRRPDAAGTSPTPARRRSDGTPPPPPPPPVGTPRRRRAGSREHAPPRTPVGPWARRRRARPALPRTAPGSRPAWGGGPRTPPRLPP